METKVSDLNKTRDVHALLAQPDVLVTNVLLVLLRRAGGFIEITDEELTFAEEATSEVPAIDVNNAGDGLIIRTITQDEATARLQAEVDYDAEWKAAYEAEQAALKGQTTPGALTPDELARNQTLIDASVREIHALADVCAYGKTPEQRLAARKEMVDAHRHRSNVLKAEHLISLRQLESQPLAPPVDPTVQSITVEISAQPRKQTSASVA